MVSQQEFQPLLCLQDKGHNMSPQQHYFFRADWMLQLPIAFDMNPSYIAGPIVKENPLKVLRE